MMKPNLKEEREADYFARCLLMPEQMFVASFKEQIQGPKDEDEVAALLAETFQVPLTQTVIRMRELKLIR